MRELIKKISLAILFSFIIFISFDHEIKRSQNYVYSIKFTQASLSKTNGLGGIASQFGINLPGSQISFNLNIHSISDYVFTLNSLKEVFGQKVNNHFVIEYFLRSRNDSVDVYKAFIDGNTYKRDSVINHIKIKELTKIVSLNYKNEMSNIFELKCNHVDSTFTRVFCDGLLSYLNDFLYFDEYNSTMKRLTYLYSCRDSVGVLIENNNKERVQRNNSRQFIVDEEDKMELDKLMLMNRIYLESYTEYLQQIEIQKGVLSMLNRNLKVVEKSGSPIKEKFRIINIIYFLLLFLGGILGIFFVWSSRRSIKSKLISLSKNALIQ